MFFTGGADDRLDDVLDGKVQLHQLSPHDRALIAGNPHTPSGLLEILAEDSSVDVAIWLLGNFDLSEEGVRRVLARHPSLTSEAGYHPQGPIEMIAATAASTLSATTMQAYMDRVGASLADWDRVHDALSRVHAPNGPTIGELVPPSA